MFTVLLLFVCLFVHPLVDSCWIAVGDASKGAIWAFVAPMLVVTVVRHILICHCNNIIITISHATAPSRMFS